MSKKPKKSLIKTITKTIRNSYRDSFVSKKESEDDMDRQADATAKVLELMRDFGDTGEGTRKIEFFFYASRIEKAHILANQLRQLDYDLEVVNSADSDQQFRMLLYCPRCCQFQLRQRRIGRGWIAYSLQSDF